MGAGSLQGKVVYNLQFAICNLPNWIMQVACDTFCLDDDNTFLEATMTLQTENLSVNTVRFVDEKRVELTQSLAKIHNRKVGVVYFFDTQTC